VAFLPTRVFEFNAADITFGSKEVTNHKVLGRQSKNRSFAYGGALYQIVHDNVGQTDPANYLDPDYQREVWHAQKSTDEGATWTELDHAGYPVGGLSFEVSGRGDAVARVGDVLWLFFTYGEEIAPGYATRFDRIHAVSFDLATEQWGSIITSGGPYYGITANTDKGHLVFDACYRGSNEIIVYHNDSDYTVSPKRAMYSIFNSSSQTWTSIDNVVFTSSTATHITPCSCAFDGTYVHFTAMAGAYFSAGVSYKPHRTLDSGNTLGTVSDMLSAYPGGLRPKNTSTIGWVDSLVVHGGEVFCAQIYYGYSRYGAPYFRQKILVMRAPTGVANPSWTVEDVESTAWESIYDADDGWSDSPAFVESGGDLYLIHPGRMLGFFGYTPDVAQYFLFTQKYGGSGVWAAPVQFWSFHENYPGSGAFDLDDIFNLSAIGDLSGTAEVGIGITGGWKSYGAHAFPYDNTVFWFRSGQVSCCCADFAY